MKQVLLDLDNNNLMALTLIVFVAVMFCKVILPFYIDNTHFILEVNIAPGQVGWPGTDSSWP